MPWPARRAPMPMEFCLSVLGPLTLQDWVFFFFLFYRDTVHRPQRSPLGQAGGPVSVNCHPDTCSPDRVPFPSLLARRLSHQDGDASKGAGGPLPGLRGRLLPSNDKSKQRPEAALPLMPFSRVQTRGGSIPCGRERTCHFLPLGHAGSPGAGPLLPRGELER